MIQILSCSQTSRRSQSIKRSPANSALVTFLPQAPASERVGSICSDKKLTLIRMVCPSNWAPLSRLSHHSIYPATPAIPNPPKSILRPKVRSSCPPLRYRSRISLRPENSRALNPSSNDRSSPISTVNYTVWFSSTFITCNASQQGQLWIVADSSTCNSNKLAPLIVMRNLQISPMII